MTPAEFITALFGTGWTEAQLPVFATMISAMQEDALRYHEIRDVLCRGTDWVAAREDLLLADEQIDSARNAGLI